jgi:hypothetical protein
VGGIWHIVSAIFMIMSAHRVSGGRATLAVLAWPILLVVLIVASYTGTLYFVMASAGGPFQAVVAPVSETTPVVESLVVYARGHEGRGPDHALRLVTESGLDPHNFLAQRWDLESVPLGESDLESLQLLAPTRKDMAVAAAAEALGSEDVVAHRLGDFVFTYHGIDFRSAPPGLWIVILSPDPDAQAPAQPLAIAVGKVDGTVVTFEEEEFAVALADQNALRAGNGLAPLPHPSTVTHSASRP